MVEHVLISVFQPYLLEFSTFPASSVFTWSPGENNKVDRPLDFEHHLFILVELKNLIPHGFFYFILF